MYECSRYYLKGVPRKMSISLVDCGMERAHSLVNNSHFGNTITLILID